MKLANNLSKVELKKSKDAVTGKMGLSWLVHVMKDFGVAKMIRDGHEKGSNREIDYFKKIMGAVMTRVAGGDRVEDIENLRADRGLLESLGWEEIMSADTYLNLIKDKRSNAKLRQINNQIIIKALRGLEEDELTYDNDATYFDSEKESANYSYQKSKQFSGLIGCIAELGMINTVDFRRGNVSPQAGIMNQLKKAVAQAKTAGKRVKNFRSDSAAYRMDVMTYGSMEGINYYISADKDEAVRRTIKGIKASQWRMMEDKYAKNEGTKWAETRHVMSKGFTVRMLVLRWENPDPDLFEASPYCYHAIVSNDFESEPMDWLKKHNGRMGTIEQSHEEIKTGLGCEYAPSHDFEKNRGYFLIGVLAYNMVEILKRFYMGVSTINWKIKTLRYRFINVCGKIVKSGRRFCCKIINVTDEVFELYKNCKSKLNCYAY
jgi:hypothetical protein